MAENVIATLVDDISEEKAPGAFCYEKNAAGEISGMMFRCPVPGDLTAIEFDGHAPAGRPS